MLVITTVVGAAFMTPAVGAAFMTPVAADCFVCFNGRHEWARSAGPYYIRHARIISIICISASTAQFIARNPMNLA